MRSLTFSNAGAVGIEPTYLLLERSVLPLYDAHRPVNIKTFLNKFKGTKKSPVIYRPTTRLPASGLYLALKKISGLFAANLTFLVFSSFSAPGAELVKLNLALNRLFVLASVISPVFAGFTL